MMLAAEAPPDFRERGVRDDLHRKYIAICRGVAIDFELLRDLSSRSFRLK